MEILGLVNSHRDSSFFISYERAVEIAKQNGLKINYSFNLKWTKSVENDFKGDYEIEISKRKRSILHTTYADKIVLIDPWTGKFKSYTKIKHKHVREHRHRDSPYW